MNPFEILSIFDWVTPAVETAKDIGYFVETGSIGRPISVNKGELNRAKKVLGKAGITVISTTIAAFSREGMVDVPDKQFREALSVLADNGIDTWGY